MAAMFRIWILMPAIVGALLALASFIAFTARLRRAHPDLWQTYRHLFYSTLASQSRSALLSEEVFTKITDQRTQRLRTLHRVCFAVYAVLAVVCGLLLLCTFALPIL
jgi:hypothetical protein